MFSLYCFLPLSFRCSRWDLLRHSANRVEESTSFSVESTPEGHRMGRPPKYINSEEWRKARNAQHQEYYQYVLLCLLGFHNIVPLIIHIPPEKNSTKSLNHPLSQTSQ